jgi:hypothetical protein
MRSREFTYRNASHGICIFLIYELNNVTTWTILYMKICPICKAEIALRTDRLSSGQSRENVKKVEETNQVVQ